MEVGFITDLQLGETMLKVDVYSTMRNEIAILPYFLRHYETFADRIFVWDDGSDDGTLEMLKAHPKVTLLPVNLGKADDEYFVQHLWPQYKTISRGHADWTICVDTDELIYHPDIVEKLKELQEKGIRKVRCEGFTMYHPTFPTAQGQIYDEVKVGVKDRWSTKTVLFNPEIDIRWDVGRHRCSRKIEPACDTGINLLHFRYLGWEYYRNRTQKNLAYCGIEFTDDRVCRMPDGSRRPPFKWFEEHKGDLVRLVE